jgi:anti-anti-sigma factor
MGPDRRTRNELVAIGPPEHVLAPPLLLTSDFAILCSQFNFAKRRNAMNIRVRVRQDTLVVRADGDLTETAAAELFGQVQNELRPRPRNVVLDLSGVESITAGALPYVFRIQHEAQARAARLILAGRSAPVQRLLEKTKVIGALEHAADTEEACRAAALAV